MNCDCEQQTTKLIKPNILVKLVQKFRPKPIPNACVRYDTEHKMWALLDPNKQYEVIQHFTMGIIENVTFQTLPMDDSKRMIACNQSNFSNIGLAYGDLYLHKSSNELMGGHNLGFDGDKFFNEDNEKLLNARKVVLMPDRRAIYFK